MQPIKSGNTTPDPPFADSRVAAVFAGYAGGVRAPLLELRSLVFDVARETPGVGALEETLKWGEPAYLTPETGSGSTIRLAPHKAGGYAIFTHCQSTIMSDFAAIAPKEIEIDGNRAVRMAEGTAPPKDALRLLIQGALTYHLRK